MSTLKKTVGKRLTFFIKKICKTYNITYNQFAEKTHVPENILKCYEQGLIFPGTDLLAYVNWNFGLNITWLYTGEGDWFIEGFVPNGKTPPPDHRQKIRRQFKVLWQLDKEY